MRRSRSVTAGPTCPSVPEPDADTAGPTCPSVPEPDADTAEKETITITTIDLDTLIAAIRACPGISRLATPGRGGAHDAAVEAALARISHHGSDPPAVAYDAESIHVSVIAISGYRLTDVVNQVHAAARPMIGSRHLTVTVEDLDPGPPPVGTSWCDST